MIIKGGGERMWFRWRRQQRERRRRK